MFGQAGYFKVRRHTPTIYAPNLNFVHSNFRLSSHCKLLVMKSAYIISKMQDSPVSGGQGCWNSLTVSSNCPARHPSLRGCMSPV
jgi:hypothetical protein